MELPQFESILFLILFVLINLCFGQFKEGDVCFEPYTLRNGTCTSLTNCQYALELIEDNINPEFCNSASEDNFNALVCCIEQREQLRRSERMCRRYHNPANTFGPSVVGGRKSLAEEFPHMAAIGYGDKDEIEWLCGGSLISEKFVLTAAHCIETLFGDPKWVRLGDLDLAVTTDDAQPQDFAIVRTVVHPEYAPPSLYHDIGLLELDKQPRLTEYVSIACLYPTHSAPETKLIATGWGKTKFDGELSSHLLAVDLDIIGNTKCNVFYKDISKNKLANGIIDKIQLCAGSNGNDTCQGDSGGPLQRKNPKYDSIVKVYDIMGITSFGRGCGLGNSAGIYTRVSAYLDWIENIVWPDL